MGDSYLKKEFKSSDVARLRNIVKKDFTSKSAPSAGYTKATADYKEGDQWEENGVTWTIKNGLRQNITKLDAAKKAARIPLACPKCSKRMKHQNDQKMYKIHKMCFDCTIDFEAQLRKAGLFEAYEKTMVGESIEAFAKDLENYVMETLSESLNTYVTEQGDMEEWKNNTSRFNEEILKKLKEYLTHIRNSNE
jgi:hypothetical protein